MKFIINSFILLVYLALMGLGVYASIIWSYEIVLFIFIIHFFLASFTIIFIFSQRRHHTAKLSWIVFVTLLPLAGAVFFFLFGVKYSRKTSLIHNISKLSQFYALEDYSFSKDVLSKKIYNKMNNTFTFMTNTSRRPIYQNTDTDFIFDGNEKHQLMLQEIKKAKKFIHIQYYIIREGEMWNSIKKLLIDKAKEGVEIRILFDAVGSIMTLKRKSMNELRRAGIRIEAFNKIFLNFLRGGFNFRNHRKVIVVDNKVAFTGGFNIGDEYINRNKKYGYWRDTDVIIRGDLVNSLHVVFAQDWFLATREDLSKKPALYFLKYKYKSQSRTIGQLIEDGPDTGESILKDILIKQILSAKNRVWITSPYLVLSDDLSSALVSASKTGVDVRIICPGISDSKDYIIDLTRSHYKYLIVNGVRIYEYGSFMHAKQLLIDDEFAIVGSLNLDYRSLFLNYESAVVLYGQKQIDQLKKQFYYDMNNSSEIIHPNKFAHPSLFKKIKLGFIKIFSPIL